MDQMAKKSELLRLLAISAHQAYLNTLVGSPAPYVAKVGQELSAPKVGDIVLEESTAPFIRDTRFPERYQEVIDGGHYIGRLISVTQEPIGSVYDHDEPWDEEYEGRPEPTVPVWTIESLLDGHRYRWHNARFIKVLDEYITRF
jgi:hypothetical protein